MESHRGERLAEAIRESLQELINYRLSDPRVGAMDVVSVTVSPDGRKAVVQVKPQAGQSPGIDALRHAKAFLRKELAASLDLYRTPELYFEEATAGLTSDRIPALLRRVRRGRPRG